MFFCLSISSNFSSLRASSIRISFFCLFSSSCIKVLMLLYRSFWYFFDSSNYFFMISILILCAYTKSPICAAISSWCLRLCISLSGELLSGNAISSCCSYFSYNVKSCYFFDFIFFLFFIDNVVIFFFDFSNSDGPFFIEFLLLGWMLLIELFDLYWCWCILHVVLVYWYRFYFFFSSNLGILLFFIWLFVLRDIIYF